MCNIDVLYKLHICNETEIVEHLKPFANDISENPKNIRVLEKIMHTRGLAVPDKADSTALLGVLAIVLCGVGNVLSSDDRVSGINKVKSVCEKHGLNYNALIILSEEEDTIKNIFKDNI